MKQDFDESRNYDDAASEAIELGNRLADRDQEANVWDIADGLLAGAVQYWLYSRQPCGDPFCEECEAVNSAEKRLSEILALTQELAKDSEYYHSPTDVNVGTA